MAVVDTKPHTLPKSRLQWSAYESWAKRHGEDEWRGEEEWGYNCFETSPNTLLQDNPHITSPFIFDWNLSWYTCVINDDYSMAGDDLGNPPRVRNLSMLSMMNSIPRICLQRSRDFEEASTLYFNTRHPYYIVHGTRSTHTSNYLQKRQADWSWESTWGGGSLPRWLWYPAAPSSVCLGRGYAKLGVHLGMQQWTSRESLCTVVVSTGWPGLKSWPR